MKFTLVEKCILFKGMSENELSECLDQLHAQEKSYQKDTLIMHAGDVTDKMGLVLSGSVTIESSDVCGNCTILSHIGPGQIFAETYALLPGEVMLVDVRANENCTLLLLNIGGLLKSPSETPWREKLIRNLLMISAHKNLALSGRSFHTSPKSARGRILSYLNSIALQKHSTEFDIPFNRQQLADYLNLERTGLSKELGRMQREGIIIYRKNHFLMVTGTFKFL